MANHLSAIRRIRANEKRRLLNKYQSKTVRNSIRKFKTLKSKDEAVKEYDKLASMIDKLAKKNVIHKNNAAHKKAALAKHLKHLS